MKSQDIFLLLKLISIAQNAEIQSAADFQSSSFDWHDWADEDDDFDHLEVPRGSPLVDFYSVRSLSAQTGISKSEVSNVLVRCYESGIAKSSRNESIPVVNTKALKEFLVFGVKYVFPAKPKELTRGISTGLTAPVFGGELKSAGELAPVWPDPKGNTSGVAVVPLFKTVPMAVRRDKTLYSLLAIVDSLRIGLPRERNLAISKLDDLLRN